MDTVVNESLYMTGKGAPQQVASGQVDLFAYDTALDEKKRRYCYLRTVHLNHAFEDIAPIAVDGITWGMLVRGGHDAALTDKLNDPKSLYTASDFLEQVTGISAQIKDELAQLLHQGKLSEAFVLGTVDQLSDVNQQILHFESAHKGKDDLASACEAIGTYLNVPIKIPTDDIADNSLSPVEAILHLSRIRYREVALTGKWWQRSSGPMIAQQTDGRYIALLPHGLNRYAYCDPDTGEKHPLTQSMAAQMLPDAHFVYRTFPNVKLNVLSIMRFALGSHIHVEAAIITLFTFIASLIQVLPPIISAQIFGELVPNHMRGMLVEVIFVLIAFQIAQIGFNIITNLGYSRIKTKIDLALQAAVWDRLLGQDLQFYYRYATGELLEKIKGLKTINDTLSLDLIKSVVNTLFSIVNVIVMYRYLPNVTRSLFWPFVGMFAVTFFLSHRKYLLGRRQIQINNEASAYNHQMISSIERIKSGFAEERAFAHWGNLEAARRDVNGHIKLMDVLNNAFKALFSLGSVAYVYYLISREPLTQIGTFVAFTGTFLIFQSAMLNLTGIVDKMLALAPIIEDVEPLMASIPDDVSYRTTPKDIDGTLELNHVSFNYEQYGHTILHDISLRIEAGQSVGILGLSGSGKTTLLKLMLGLYPPTGGKIYFGGYDITAVDTGFLRRQLGVVMQNGELAYGSILSSITQNDPSITYDDVQEVLSVVELKERIAELPHGIYTTFDASVPLSGGEIQRLLIARAIVKKRPYLFFDEASSRLDNIVTDKIMQHIKEMGGTKIIITQRIASIQFCDRIIVLDDGKIVGDGTRDELMAEGGPLRSLLGLDEDAA